MSTATERSTTDVQPTDGRGPGGMWWVAWRQHRRLLIGWCILVLALGAAAIATSVALRDRGAGTWCTGNFVFVGPDCPDDYVRAMYDDFLWWRRLQVVIAALPAVAGLFAGVALFAGEFDRGTQVFAMTQSVGRLRWFVTKSLAVGVPLVVGSAVMGSLAAATRDVFRPFREPWDEQYQLATSGWVAASLCIMGLAIGVMLGLILRNPLATVVVGLVGVVAIIAALTLYRTHLIPASRSVYSVGSNTVSELPAGNVIIDSGYLDAVGREVAEPNCDGTDAQDPTEQRAALDRCFTANGITSWYTNFITPDRAGELRGVVSGICAAIAALFLAAGAFVLRRRAL